MKKNKKSEFVKWMGPILEALRTLGGSGTPKEVSKKVAEILNVPDEILEAKLKSGVQRFHNQVCWARQYLVWEGYLDSTKRGIWTISKTGENKTIDEKEGREIFLKWVDIHTSKRKIKEDSDEDETVESIDEVESISDNNTLINLDHREELLKILRIMSWQNFEKFSLLLLRENGLTDLKLTGGSKDDGIDGVGILKVNPFVTFKVLFQCKRYGEKNPVQRQHIAEFRNSLIGRADKGIFITTSYFTADAIREASREGAQSIELVDSEKLVELIEENELGLEPIKSFKIKYEFFQQFEK